MKTSRISIIILLGFLLLLPLYSGEEEKAPQTPRPLEDIKDIIDWKSIRTSVISKDGMWFGYRLAPQEGDGNVIFKQTKGDKEYKFPAGEAQGFASGDRIVISDNAKWAAFTILPTQKEAKQAKKTKKKTYNKMGLLDLTTGKMTEFEKVRSFSFSGENPDWIALQKYAPQGTSRPSAMPSAGGRTGQESEDRVSGSDMILIELGKPLQLNIGNVSQFTFDNTGRWLAWIIDANDKSGNGVMIRDMKSGVITPLDTDKAVYKRLSWTEKGNALSVLIGKDHEDYKDKLYSVIGWTGFTAGSLQKTVFNPQKQEGFPAGMTISSNRSPQWTEALDGILFGINEVEKKKKKEKPAEKDIKKEGKAPEAEKDKTKNKAKPEPKKKPPKEDEIDKEDLPGVVIWHWKDKRMQSMQQVQAGRDKNFNFLCIYRIKEKKLIRLADENVRNVSVASKERWAVGTDNQKYELMGNLDGRRYSDVYVFDLQTGEKTLVLEKIRWFFGPSPEGSHLLFYKDGHFYTYEMATGKTFNITKEVPTSFINTEDDHNVVDPPIYPRIGWTKGAASVLLYDNWDIWNVPAHGGKAVNLTVNGKTEKIRYRTRYRLDPDEKGIDLAKPLYVMAYGEWTKKAGIGLISKGKPGVKMLLWDDAVFSMRKAEKAPVYFYIKQTYKEYGDYYVAKADLKNGQKITNANPQQKDFHWSSGGMLVDYESAKGDKLQAALYLPANYEKGKSYPTIVYFYEKLSNSLNRYYAPSAYGFNKTIYTSRGYAVLMPDIVYKVDDPGMSAVWCVLPAIKAAVATGIVDKDHIGVQGHSWGGYQSSFLITQTDVFAACVTGAPLTNMISMYSSIYWNSGSANQAIFESSQGRFTGGYWDNQDAYIRNSPVFFAENVTTPTVILHNDKDGAVDWNQGIEYFNTLRRLGKKVVMLQYTGENHGLRKPPNRKDYYIRMREFFDHYLMGKPAPEWWSKGVSHLDHEDHIKDKTKKIK